MKNIITIALLFVATISQAQNAQDDSLRLLLYNTGTRFQLTSADFSGSVTQTLIGTMVRAYDTVMVLKANGATDSTGKKRMMHSAERRADKISKDIKDKIVVMEYNKDVDVTQTCMNVQRGGAIALIIIHQSDKKNEIKLKKAGIYKDSIRIPCFTLQNSAGDSLYAMLPTAAMIRLPRVNVQSLIANNAALQNPTAQQQKDKEKNALNTEGAGNKESIELGTASNLTGLNANEWRISPNPTSHTATLSYYFTQAAPLSIEVFNAAGQLIKQYKLNSSVGTLDIDVSNWSNGVYNVRLVSDKQKEVKRLVVSH